MNKIVCTCASLKQTRLVKHSVCIVCVDGSKLPLSFDGVFEVSAGPLPHEHEHLFVCLGFAVVSPFVGLCLELCGMFVSTCPLNSVDVPKNWDGSYEQLSGVFS